MKLTEKQLDLLSRRKFVVLAISNPTGKNSVNSIFTSSLPAVARPRCILTSLRFVRGT